MSQTRGGRRCERRRGSAFTLVELLVVVSIIALLIAILLPALKRARNGAKRVTCSTRVRGLAQASLTYATDDPHENSIPLGIGDVIQPSTRNAYYGYGGKSGRGEGGLRRSIWGGRNLMGTPHRPLNTVLYKSGFAGAMEGPVEDWSGDTRLDLGLYECPGDTGFAGVHQAAWRDGQLSSYDHFGTSYVAVALFVYQVAVPTEFLYSNSVYARPISRVPTPAGTLMYLENAGRYAYRADNPEFDRSALSQCREPLSSDFVARGWHGTPWQFNASFADGHGAWVKIRGFGATRAGSSGNDACRQGRCACIMIRGDQWQMDTLPANMIKTSHPNMDG